MIIYYFVDGFFIEAGAHDFQFSSNSLYFELKYNWTVRLRTKRASDGCIYFLVRFNVALLRKFYFWLESMWFYLVFKPKYSFLNISCIKSNIKLIFHTNNDQDFKLVFWVWNILLSCVSWKWWENDILFINKWVKILILLVWNLLVQSFI